ncbi:MAG: hypothetical protein A2Y75_05315 [Candidatus Solincola sediminis]|uniref:DUF932 domain-containing protein n=1 Tax=Candidatus Solincola sediminis TaxID=1797199 RepID=A0A1F2WG70_9ACTN|nr:MAG: hypothetical protein A2Y75_05315 [Candidatus Solincola sediminis]
MTVAHEAPASGTKMFSTDDVPWMKLGKLSSDSLTLDEAIHAAGLDFTVSPQPVMFRRGEELLTYDGRFVITRDDTGAPLGVVSDEYTPVQYSDAFRFMETINARFVAAGALNGARQGFVVVKLEGTKLDVFDGQDPHDLFAVLRTSHDRTRGIEVCVMPLRYRCMNQLTMPSFGSDATLRWSIRHTKSVHDRLAEAEATIANVKKYAIVYADTAQRLASITLSTASATEILTKYVLPNYAKKRDDVAQRIIEMWRTDDRIGAAYSHNGWGLVQAVSTYYDHDRTGGSPQSRFLAAIEGQTQKAIAKTAGVVLSRYAK